MNNISVKEVILAVVSMCAIIGSFLLWRTTAHLMAEQAFNSYNQFIASVGFLVIASSLFGISAIFIRNPKMVYTSLGISVIVPFFFIPATNLGYVTVGVCLLLTLFAVRRIRKEFGLSFGFSVASLFKTAIPLFLTVCGVIISLFYLNDIQNKDAIQAIFPRPAFNISIRALGGPLRSITGNESFTPDETVDQFFLELAKKQLADRGIKISQVPPAELNRLLVQQRTEIARSYGIKLTGHELLGDVFYTTIIERVNDLLGPYRVYAPYASAVTFFLAFKTLSVFLYLVVVAVAFLIIKLMIMMKLVVRKKEQVEVDRLILS